MRILQSTYNNENLVLLQYLKQKPIESSEHWYFIKAHWHGWEELLEELELSEAELADAADRGDYESFYKIDEWFDQHEDSKYEIGEILAEYDPVNAPSWVYLNLEKQQLLPATTWLVHWTDHPETIARRGFEYGVWEVSRLGLTTHLNKDGPGYNFEFPLRHADISGDNRYGRHCVMFQSSCVLCYHVGDEEYQAIFWGPSITTRPIAIVDQEDQWQVLNQHQDKVVGFDKVKRCFDWVVQNASQYKLGRRS